MPTDETVLDPTPTQSNPVEVEVSLEDYTDNGDTDVVERLDTIIEIISTEETEETSTEETELEETTPEQVEIANESPIAVVLVEEEEISTFALTGDAYAGTINTTYLEYFKGYVDDLPYNMDYLLYRPDNTSYLLFYADDLQETEGVFTGTGSFVELYSSNGTYISRGDDTISVDVGTAPVYSSLVGYPDLITGGTGLESTTLLFTAAFACLYIVLRDMFKRVLLCGRR